MSIAISELWTGLPGNGKTLFVIEHLHKLRQEEPDLPIYVHGIDWKDKGIEEINPLPIPDPNEWHLLPAPCYVVIDECQDVFPKRPNNSAVPDKCAMFAKLRHDGFRTLLITQDAKDIDPFVTRKIGKHTHLERMAGAEATQHVIKPKVFDPDSKAARKGAEFVTRTFPKKYYDYYRSAETHTMKFKMPKAFRLGIYSILFAVFAISFFIYKYHNGFFTDITGTKEKPASDGLVLSKKESPASLPSGPSSKPKTEKEFFDERKPLIQGFPQTAPRYDSMSTPVRAQKLTMCVLTASRCECYNQDGGKIPDTPKRTCEYVAKNGYFDDTIPDRQNIEPSNSLAANPLTDSSQKLDTTNQTTIKDVTGADKKWPIKAQPYS
ncbi:zonular occludens toxin domain-containing protein [Leeia sp. TBRC 13508]|uniref:Zonular occludens toxin domain-containing protein n=1 Tax=Leeia speluncae TaxID=2884804 RepID=A0ABS8DB14_9NEIS|nr:zonular occludens toxin domain-containing protein [Leeia speluncae]MCB6185406.1 zonular occludens toxin domain-containing protein [Leeia speluncae]